MWETGAGGEGMTPEEAALALKDSLDIDTRAKLEGWLVSYCKARDAESQAKSEKEGIGKALKDWLEEHPDEVLYDMEHGLQAYLQTRQGSDRYDVSSMPPELILRLHQAHALQLDVQVIKALSGKDILPEDVKPYRVPAEQSVALQVKQV